MRNGPITRWCDTARCAGRRTALLCSIRYARAARWPLWPGDSVSVMISSGCSDHGERCGGRDQSRPLTLGPHAFDE